ncbi:tetrapyrrole methylase [Auricularia subglabra TFB-10046 SS5]|nr:tetrapyrrole methylase [Auricularia subglabra TFB-10046 SS5]
MTALSYPSPVPGASLLLAFRPTRQTVLIVGTGTLAATRAFAALEADARVVVFCPFASDVCEELAWRAEHGQVELCRHGESEDELAALDRLIGSASPRLVCVTDTIRLSPSRRTHSAAQRIRELCAASNVPLNVADMPDLCDFTFLAAHRSGEHVQVGFTTNGHGCRLAGRLRRELVAALPKGLEAAVRNVSRLRELAKTSAEDLEEEGEVNAPVPQQADEDEAKRRMRWIAQVSEYWPFDKLASLAEDDMQALLASPSPVSSTDPLVVHASAPTGQKGRIYLVGSGPGHPALLTRAAHTLLTSPTTHAVLSDKLVPSSILSLIPPHTTLHIARKFPGNADRAQTELIDTALALLAEGKTVVRLKQGDPALYGRLGEEVLALRAAGYEPVCIPGLSSALAAPLLSWPSAIPVTQRGVADAVALCTGVGRGGKTARVPPYERSRTTCVLMAAARVQALVEAMIGDGGAGYPPWLPVALVERGSMRDQRTLCTTLQHLVEAMDALGEQRPPGMLVVGWSVLCLDGTGFTDVLDEPFDEAVDRARVGRWLGNVRWKVHEGLDPAWDSL